MGGVGVVAGLVVVETGARVDVDVNFVEVVDVNFVEVVRAEVILVVP